ncbi:MAG: ECF-type sigma factor [Phycisphaerales bacterium]|jgi:RNA polymerase sigma factor (TIGR02999 family)|nr:ECF-type sigma factor [Phycisphaerales bacterium]
MAAFHAELGRIARHLFGSERADHTLQPTALVNELWVRMIEHNGFEVRSEAEFRAWAARAMRNILVDHARRKRAMKRGGGDAHVVLIDIPGRPGIDVLDLHEALIRLESQHERSARVVEMRFFGGLTQAQTAERLGVTERTVRADWQLARAWLHQELLDATPA